MGTVSAGPEGIVEHPTSTPAVEYTPPGRAAAVAPEASATPEVPEIPSSEREGIGGEEIDEDALQDQPTPDEQQQEFEHNADDVREQEFARTSEQTTGPERERAAIDREERGVGPRRCAPAGRKVARSCLMKIEKATCSMIRKPIRRLNPTTVRKHSFPKGFREDAWNAGKGARWRGSRPAHAEANESRRAPAQRAINRSRSSGGCSAVLPDLASWTAQKTIPPDEVL